MSEVTCPHCQCAFNVEPRIIIPEEQRLSVEMTMENEHFSAKTLGGVISSIDKLMKSVAKDAGGKVEMMVEGLQKDGKTLRLDFVIVEASVNRGESR